MLEEPLEIDHQPLVEFLLGHVLVFLADQAAHLGLLAEELVHEIAGQVAGVGHLAAFLHLLEYVQLGAVQHAELAEAFVDPHWNRRPKV